MTTDKTSKFPNAFAPPSVKNTAKYCKQYAEAFHTEAANLPTEAALSRANKNYKRYRQYARGEQSQQQYKELLGLKKAKDGQNPNTSFRNLNFEILKVAPKIRNVLVNKIVNQGYRMSAKAIDPKSISERRKYKNKLLEFIVNKEAIEQFEKLTKIGLERPVPQGEAPPMNAMEVDPYIDMNPKDVTSMEVLDFITMNYHENDWTQLGKEIAGDLVDLGIGGTRQYIDVNNKIRIKRIIPEKSVCNKCIYPDFRDMIRFGEYIELTVGELRRVTKGAWGEKVYQEIANKVSGNNYAHTSSIGPNPHYNADTYSYAYDHENVTVFECLWYSTDSEVHVEYTNESGNKRIKQEKSDYVPFRGDQNVNGGKGMSDEEFNKFHEGRKKIIRTEVRNVYTCSWVVDTEHVYNFGLMKNMLRPTSNWQETIMPVTLISTDFMSTIGLIEQPLDQVQLNYLQMQSHVNASKPPGIAIEKHALSRLNKGSKKFDPKEALMMYAETGNLIYDGYDAHEVPLNQKPFENLDNGLSKGATDHFTFMMQWIDVIRNMVGLNVMTEGQTPPERLGKDVANLSFGASDNALSHLTAAFKSLYERTGRNVFYLLQNNVQRMNPDQISESLGSESYKYFMLNRDLALKDMGIILEEGPNDKVREKISALLQLMVENKEIPGEDAVMIEMLDNPYRQVLLIRKHRLERERLEAAKQENLVRAQGEENTKTAMATEQAKHDAELKKQEFELEKTRFEKEREAEEKAKDRKHELMMKYMELIADEEAQDKDIVAQQLAEMIKGDIEIQKAKMKPKPKPAAKK
jgi:hypothetical protein